MRAIAVFSSLILLCAACYALAGNNGSLHFPAQLADCLNKISGHIYNDQFEQAEHLIDSLQNNGVSIASSHFSRAVLFQAQMMAAESDSLNDEYFAVLDSLESDARDMISRDGDSALAYCYLGHAHAFRSLRYGRSGSIWKALKSGLAARKAYDRGYKIDSSFHDIALGLGSYRYWKSDKTKIINWTPLFKNERKNGIKLLCLAADSSEISTDAAIVSLIWVYINEKKFDEAIRLAIVMRNKYPEGLTFLWALGQAHYKRDDYHSAMDIYENILSNLKQDPGNYYNIIEASYYLSECYRKLIDQAPEFSIKLSRFQDEIRSSPLPEATRKRQKKKIKNILKEYD